ncbi:Rieske 2Fe-2S domain-containing protein [Actinoplanes xinjiangensis]|uniref:Rieske-like 2Fe-2S protein n=1 Tax=Actinoplanes xinjiangensis TaxID=512350 RepID=A0A316FEH6_9ACTN|nr:Rieske 2Fe-2S domain-containing protein [Actinoplanes xinjiangensis]PWK36030.1 Rieske-like 2Fe-2S protein [Actinoplanes xinjiangensis]GIF42972.1 hypothetical protein Axi01nite_72830 [Actinoplanes xinjiangensis]
MSDILRPSASDLAASWYIAMPSNKLGAKPVPLQLFGREVVAWRDGAGRPSLLPRYCPHQGASLAVGKVVDGTLRCPFHGWRFDNTGACVRIPVSARIPSTARLAPFPTEERYGYVWAWYGGAEPIFPLPDFSALDVDRDQYTGFRFDDSTAGTARQLLENAIDYFHFLTLHGLAMDPLEFRVLHDPEEARDNGSPIHGDAFFGAWLDGRVQQYPLLKQPSQWLLAKAATYFSGENFQLLVDGWPGGQRYTGYIDGKEVYKVFLAITPVRDGLTRQRGWALVKKSHRRSRTLFDLMLLYGQSRGGTAQDIPIYNHTRAEEGRSYVRYDNGLLKYRKHYQSWVDRVDADPIRSGAPS